jgi:hypothetical protein
MIGSEGTEGPLEGKAGGDFESILKTTENYIKVKNGVRYEY